MTVTDPSNPKSNPDSHPPDRNALLVPDPIPDPTPNFPRHRRPPLHHSAIAADDRDFFVYTPCLRSQAQGPTPVLYLLHGLGGDSNG